MNTTGPIIVGVDGSEGGHEALRWALAESAKRNSRLVAVAAWSWLDQHGKFDVDYGAEDVSRMTASAVERARQDLGSRDHVDVEIRPINDHATRALIEASADASLLVVGSRGLGGFRGLLLGSVSAQCIHHAHCPVVVIPGSNAS